MSPSPPFVSRAGLKLDHALATFGALMAPDLPLGRRQHEMIATVVSVTNRCRYCSESHAEFLRRVTPDEGLIRALREDLATAPVSEPDRVMLEYAVKLTKDASRVTPEDHERLRSVGFDDRAILQITLIAAWFNYINRVADARRGLTICFRRGVAGSRRGVGRLPSNVP